MRSPFSPRLASCLLLLPLLATACGGGRYGQPDRANSQLSFGVAMAQRGLWSEALFRFHQAERMEPQNPRVLNNLGVAYEAAGEYERALEYYQRALKIDTQNRELRANYARFVEFYQSFKPRDEKAAATPGQPAAGAAASPAPGTPESPVPVAAPAPDPAPDPVPGPAERPPLQPPAPVETPSPAETPPAEPPATEPPPL